MTLKRTTDPRRPWARWQLADLLALSDLDGLPEEPFEHDGWSGSALRLIDRGDRRFVLKRTSPSRDWIVRATHDDALREAWFATALAATGPTASGSDWPARISERLPTATMRRSSCPTCRRSSSRGSPGP